MLPDYITAHLRNPLIVHPAHHGSLSDPQATWRDLGMNDGARDLTRMEIAMLIEEHFQGAVTIADSAHEAWETLADVAETARGFEGVGG